MARQLLSYPTAPFGPDAAVAGRALQALPRLAGALRSRLVESQAATAAPSGYRFAVTSNWLFTDPAFYASQGTVSIGVLVAGVYRINTTVLQQSATAVNTRMEVSVRINNVAQVQSRAGANTDLQATHTISTLMSLAVNDAISVWAETGGAAYQGADNRFCHLDIEYLGTVT